MTTPIVRKNTVVISTTFAAADGSTTQPSAANAVLSYYTPAQVASLAAGATGVTMTTSTIALTYNAATNQWSGTWDSSAAGDGTVFWMVYGYGTLQAADEGCFVIEANSANTV